MAKCLSEPKPQYPSKGDVRKQCEMEQNQKTKKKNERDKAKGLGSIQNWKKKWIEKPHRKIPKKDR